MTVAQPTLTVGVWQDSGLLGDVAANMATISRATAQASRRGVHLLVFPECFLTGYFNREETERIARQIDQDTVSALCAVAKSNATAILVGYYDKQPSGLYNAALLIGADGAILANYRKRALYGDWEHSAFLRGTKPVLVEYRGIKIAVLICFDIEFPELARECARDGADLIAVPTSLMEPHGRIVRHVIPARAIENQVYIAYANRIGREHELRYVGRSAIYDPEGTLLAQATHDSPELLVAPITESIVNVARSEFSYVEEIRKTFESNATFECNWSCVYKMLFGDYTPEPLAK